MRAHVRMQIRCAVEGFFAHDADVWFDSGMSQSVTCEVSRLSEGTAAYFTFEWLFSSMDSLE